MAAVRSIRRLAARDWAREALIFLVAYLVYEAARTIWTGSAPAAIADAHRVLGVERDLHLDIEAGFQRALEGTAWLTLLSWVYLAAQSLALAGALVFVYRRSRAVYRTLRTTLIGAWAVALPVYALFPTAPPRLAGMGVADSVSHATPFSLNASSTSVFYNPYAAVPSLHAAFAIALAVGVAVCLRHWTARAAALAWGPVVVVAVLATGNHFLLDVAAGLGATLIGWAASRAPSLWAWLHTARRPPRAPGRQAPGYYAGRVSRT